MFCGERRIKNNLVLRDLKSIGTALRHAAKTGDVVVLRTTIQAASAEHGLDKSDLAHYINSLCTTELHVAARHGHLDMVECLLGLGCAANPPDPKDGLTPLQIATILGHRGIVRALVRCGASTAPINAGGRGKSAWAGMTPLDVAVGNGDRELAAVFLCADPSSASANTSPSVAPESQCIAAVGNTYAYALACVNHAAERTAKGAKGGKGSRRGAGRGRRPPSRYTVALASDTPLLHATYERQHAAACRLQAWWPTVSRHAQRQHQAARAATLIQAAWRMRLARHNYRTIIEHSNALRDRATLHADIARDVARADTAALDAHLLAWPDVLAAANDVARQYAAATAGATPPAASVAAPRQRRSTADTAVKPPRFYNKVKDHGDRVLVYNLPSARGYVLEAIRHSDHPQSSKIVFQREWGATPVTDTDGSVWINVSNPGHRFGGGRAFVCIVNHHGQRLLAELRTSNYLAMGEGCVDRLDVAVINIDRSVASRRAMDETFEAPKTAAAITVDRLNWVPPKTLADGPGPLEAVLLVALNQDTTAILEHLCASSAVDLATPVLEDGGALLHACAADARGPGKIGAVLRVLTTAARLARGLPGGASAAFPNTVQRLLEQVDGQQRTPLMVACHAKAAGNVAALLETGHAHADFVQTCYPDSGRRYDANTDRLRPTAGGEGFALPVNWLYAGMHLELECPPVLEPPTSVALVSARLEARGTAGASTAGDAADDTITVRPAHVEQSTLVNGVRHVTVCWDANGSGNSQTRKSYPLASKLLHPPGWASLQGSRAVIQLPQHCPADLLLRGRKDGCRVLDWNRYTAWRSSQTPRRQATELAGFSFSAKACLTPTYLVAPANAVLAKGTGLSAASIAARDRSETILRNLAEAGVDFSGNDGAGQTLILRALERVPNREEHAANAGAGAGASRDNDNNNDVELTVEEFDVDWTPAPRRSRPGRESWQQHLDAQVASAIGIIDFLVNAGCPFVNQPNRTGETPLMQAVCWPDSRVADHLINMHHADVGSKDDDGNTVLAVASRNGCPDNVDAVLAHLAARAGRNGSYFQETDAVLNAAQAGRPAVITALLDNGVPLGLHAKDIVAAFLAAPPGALAGLDAKCSLADMHSIRDNTKSLASRAAATREEVRAARVAVAAVVRSAVAAAEERLVWACSHGSAPLRRSATEARAEALLHLKDALAAAQLHGAVETAMSAQEQFMSDEAARRIQRCWRQRRVSPGNGKQRYVPPPPPMPGVAGWHAADAGDTTTDVAEAVAETTKLVGKLLSHDNTVRTLSLSLENSLLCHDINSFHAVAETLEAFPWAALAGVGPTLSPGPGASRHAVEIVDRVVQAYEAISSKHWKWPDRENKPARMNRTSARELVYKVVTNIVSEAPLLLDVKQTAIVVSTIVNGVDQTHTQYRGQMLGKEDISLISALFSSLGTRDATPVTTPTSAVSASAASAPTPASLLAPHLEMMAKRCAQVQVSSTSLAPGLREAAIEFLRLHAPQELQVCGICDTAYDDDTRRVAACTATTHEHFKKRACGHGFCNGCLAQWIEVTLKDNSASIKCPHAGCDVNLFADDVRRIAGSEAETKFVALQSADHCERLLDLLKTQKQLVESIKAEAKPCPRCCVVIYKHAGCDSMLCSCGHRFNWSSVRQWPTIADLEKKVAAQHLGRTTHNN